MRKVLCAFKPFVVDITHDFMLIVCIIAPILMGFLFRFVIPVIEKTVCQHFDKSVILTPYYTIFDMILATLTPVLFCMAGVFVVLDEIDCATAKYYSVTPLGKRGYLFSRIGIPALFALVYNGLLLSCFKLSDILYSKVILLIICGVMIAVATSMFSIAFAKNRMEGMALSKMSAMIIIGIPVSYFVTSPFKYCFGILPTFWMSELCIKENILYFVLSVLVAGVMIFVLYKRFQKKMM